MFIRDESGAEKRIGITRAHLEEDAGKSLHERFDKMSGIDLNRAGTPLLEIVSEPEMSSAKEVVAYMRKIHTIVRYLEISDGNMQEGSFRCDANVSVRPRGQKEIGTRTEIKNLNSFRFVEKAINFEVERQIDLIEDGGKVAQETRLYDSDKHETRSMLSKEEANDYRYFPDPDLPALAIDGAWVEEIRGRLPELASKRGIRFVEQYGIPEYDAKLLTGSKNMADYFEEAAGRSHSTDKSRDKFAKSLSNWMLGDLSRLMNLENLDITQIKVSPTHLAELIDIVDVSADVDAALLPVDVGQLHAQDLGGAQPGIEQQPDQRAVAAARLRGGVAGGQELFDLRRPVGLDHAVLEPRRGDRRHGRRRRGPRRRRGH